MDFLCWSSILAHRTVANTLCVFRVGHPAWSCQTESPPTSHIPLPVILPPGQLKLGWDSEHLCHRKGISQLAAPVDPHQALLTRKLLRIKCHFSPLYLHYDWKEKINHASKGKYCITLNQVGKRKKLRRKTRIWAVYHLPFASHSDRVTLPSLLKLCRPQWFPWQYERGKPGARSREQTFCVSRQDYWCFVAFFFFNE